MQVMSRVLAIIFMFGSFRGFSSEVHEGNTAFALELYGQLKSRPGNLFFSPVSISTCLAMTYAGARGDTEKQMARVLRFGNDQQKTHDSFAELQRKLSEASKQNGIELNIANALWMQEGHPFLPAFLEIAKGQYQANINQADFKTGADSARHEINRWVAEKTKDKIQNILPPGSIQALTRLVLVNAIYFKGLWAKPYNKNETTNQPFKISTTSQVNVPLMHHFDNVRYAEIGEFQAVELPYRSNELSMVVLLPREVEGSAKLESRLTATLLAEVLGKMKQQRVEIFLPRFKLESSLDLGATLAGMGMQDAFGPKADFSAMDGRRLLYISGVFHKAWGEVNEEGTEAAAATAAIVAARAIQKPIEPPPIFRADHPFIFFIRESGSGSLLFIGRFASPTP